MKNNSSNNNLIKRNNNFFSKIKNAFLSLFMYKEKKSNCKNTEISINTNIKNKPSDLETNFLDSLRYTETEDTKIYNLQKKYEDGELKVTELSDDEYYKLEDLYNIQIENLINKLKYAKSKL